jgi:beta-mannosidase
MVAGVYGKLFIQAVETGRVEYVYTLQKHSKGLCEVEVFAEILSEKGGETLFEASLADVSASKKVALQPGLNLVSLPLKVKNPKLWWPNGLGEQYLYALAVKACGETVSKKLGLRKMELISEEDKDGLSLLVRVNGVDVFSKGADWIPNDALPQRQTAESIRGLLESAAQAHMNCLRVWGGGQYESDEFYGICDELGLMIWQDFMFSCALYPADKKFLASVRAEAEYQVKRLRDFACIALWCGNNEDVGALGWFKESKESRDRYLVDYDRLNEGVLGDSVDKFDPQRKFWPSSPCGGRGDYSDCFHADNRGDMHYWEVWHGGKPFEQYYKIKPRFCSEFGYQSFPSVDSIRSNVTSPVMEHHQRNGGGNSKIIEMMSRYFRMPEGFENFVYLSQVQQAIAIKTGTEHWRRLRPYCMGTIYWQLNDNWPVCSWASLEYSGKWKLLHYAALRFFDDVMVVGVKTDDGGFEVHAANDLLKDVSGKLKVSFIGLDGKAVKTESSDAKLKKSSAKMLKAFKASELPFKPNEGFVKLELETDGGSAFNELFLAPWKAMKLPQAKVSLEARALADGRFEVEASVDKPAFFFSLNADGLKGEFDKNCFALLPGAPTKFVFEPKGKLSLKQFKDSLSFRHLRMTYK